MPAQPIQSLQLDYYNVLTSEYKNLPKFSQWLMATLTFADDVTNCLLQILNGFDIDYAVGSQLDIIGSIVGAKRILPFQPSGGVSSVLDDVSFKLLIRAAIANNQWDGRLTSIYPAMKVIFPLGSIIVIDHQDMTATVILTGSYTSIVQDMITNDMIIPRPQAVMYSYVFGELPLFGFDRNDSLIAGFDTGKWS